MFTPAYFWAGYEPLIFAALLGMCPLIGFAIGCGRGGRSFVGRTWRWLEAYYAAVVISLFLPLFNGPFFVSAVCFVLTAGPLVGVVLVAESFVHARRVSAAPAPLCEACGYNLTGNVSGICPECGRPISWRPDYDLFTEDPAKQAEGDLGDSDEADSESGAVRDDQRD